MRRLIERRQRKRGKNNQPGTKPQKGFCPWSSHTAHLETVASYPIFPPTQLFLSGEPGFIIRLRLGREVQPPNASSSSFMGALEAAGGRGRTRTNLAILLAAVEIILCGVGNPCLLTDVIEIAPCGRSGAADGIHALDVSRAFKNARS